MAMMVSPITASEMAKYSAMSTAPVIVICAASGRPTTPAIRLCRDLPSRVRRLAQFLVKVVLGGLAG